MSQLQPLCSAGLVIYECTTHGGMTARLGKRCADMEASLIDQTHLSNTSGRNPDRWTDSKS